MRGYVQAPALAWSGYRLRLPVGPVGGEYHGYIGPDSTGWPGGRDELSGLSGVEDPDPWGNLDWGGTIFGESEGHSDYVYRSPGEVRPRANASGGANVIRALQAERTAGYAESPGNYRALGLVQVNGGRGAVDRGVNVLPGRTMPAVAPMPSPPPIRFLGPPVPAPRCGSVTLPNGQRIFIDCAQPGPIVALEPGGSGATATTPQPPPPIQPAPAPIVSDPMMSCAAAGFVGPGYYRDAAGNCTNDWRNPASLYLPAPQSPRPAPTVAATPADYLPSTGQVVPGITPGATSTNSADWLNQSTIWPGVANQWIVGAAVLGALFFMRGSAGGRK